MTDQINITHREHPIPQVTDFAVQYASILKLDSRVSMPDDNCDRIVRGKLRDGDGKAEWSYFA